jgi:DNA-binding winged helix-turn-helix (wHTH) protein/TolB-like protein
MSAQDHTPEPRRSAGANGAASAGIADSAGSRAVATSFDLTLRFSSYELDFARKELRREGAPVALQPTPLRVLLYLAEHRDRTVPRRELLDAIWPGVVVGDEALTTALAEARHAVGDDGAAQRVIRTLKGAGYRFVARVELVGGGAASAAWWRSRRAAVAGAALVACMTTAAFTLVSRHDASERPDALLGAPHLLAVIPFRNLTPDPALDALAEGLTADISAAIQPPARLIPSATMRAYENAPIDVRELERSLGATHVLQGTVQALGDSVRVTIQLHETAGARLSWSGILDEPRGNLHAAQTSVASQAAARIPLFLPHTSEESSEIAKAVDLGERLIRGWAHEQAFEVLSAVLARDPDNTRARAALIAVWGWLLNSEKRSPSEATATINRLASETQRLAPGSLDAHSAAAYAALVARDWEVAEREARAGCALAATRIDLACTHLHAVLLATARASEASEITRSQLDLFPTEALLHQLLALDLLTQRRYDDALREFRIAEQLNPLFLGSSANLLWLMGRRDDYVAGLRATLAKRGDTAAIAEIDRLHAAEGPRGVARWAAEHPARVDPGNPTWILKTTAAVAFMHAGDHDRALEALESQPFNTELPYSLTWPMFDPLRDHPRFQALVEREHLTAYHAKYLTRPRVTQPGSRPQSDAGAAP